MSTQINKTKGFIIPLIITIIAILAIGGVVYFAPEKRVEAPVVITPNVSVQVATTTINTEDWKTYKNEKYGFEFNYPGYITLENLNEDKSYGFIDVLKVNNASLPNTIRISVDSAKGEKSFTDYINKYPIIDGNTNKPFMFTARVIGNNTFYSTLAERFEGDLSFEYCIFNNGMIYCFHSFSHGVDWTNPNLDTENDSTHLTLKLILSTLKFTTPVGEKVEYFLSPQKDAVFNFGDTVIIKWNPSVIDASTIYLNCIDSVECSGYNYQIYKRQNLEDPVSINGSLSYLLPVNYTGPTPGKYRVVVYSYGQKENIKSPEFRIISPVETAPKTLKSHYIKDIFGQENKYKTGESIKIFIDARDYDGVPASPDRGFNIQAHIFDANNYPGNSFQAVNASYDKIKDLWKIEMTAPTDKSIIYSLKISLYCGYSNLKASNELSSVCAQEHGIDNSQVEKTIIFSVQ